jgi:DNA mismatch repair protein MutL
MSAQHIRILDKTVAERIAAGEVVERPASVVKELIENAIDAEAHAISVEIREGGVSLIRVSDNGSGMSRADAPLSVERFATSKVTTAEDLNAIGTQVMVRNLFYNTPARRKFLKTPMRETELVQKTLVTYALAYPHIAFRLVVDGRESLVCPAASPLERIGAVWGREVAAEMVQVDYPSLDLSVRGFVSGPTLARASRQWQAFFVNSRPIRSGLLAVMLERPYAGRLPPNRHPLAVLEIEADPHLVDVNVHPRKAEVRFYQERAIYGAVTRGVQEALRDFPYLDQGAFSLTGTTDWSFADAGSAELTAPALREWGIDYGAGPWRALGQIHNTYILAQSAEGLVIVDQHAAQEQIFYERLTTSECGALTAVRDQVQVTPREAELLREHLEEYHTLGIDIEPFGGNTFRLAAIPSFIPLNPPELITALVQEHERYRALDDDALRDKLAAKAACLSAVKAGDVLDLPQQQALLDELSQIYSPATCPHGRPVFVVLRLEELERRFLRR